MSIWNSAEAERANNNANNVGIIIIAIFARNAVSEFGSAFPENFAFPYLPQRVHMRKGMSDRNRRIKTAGPNLRRKLSAFSMLVSICGESGISCQLCFLSQLSHFSLG